MGLLTAAETAAFLVIGLPAGAWVDRMRKRRVLHRRGPGPGRRAGRRRRRRPSRATPRSRCSSSPALVISVASVFFDVSHQSYVPGLVGLDHLVEGNSKLQATQSVAQVAAPAIGGLLLRVITAPALIARQRRHVPGLGVRRRPHPARRDAPAPRHPPPAAHRDRRGLSFVVHEPYLRRIVATHGAGQLRERDQPAPSLVIYVLRVLDLGTAAWGAVLSASAVGGLVGAVVAGRLAQWVGEARLIPLSDARVGARGRADPAGLGHLADPAGPAAHRRRRGVRSSPSSSTTWPR